MSARGKEGYDGRVGDSYEAPASRRKGPQELPRWRDPDWSRENWKTVGKLSKLYVVFLFIIPTLLLLWGAGYALGVAHGYTECRETVK